jgi:hypothetical protein
LGFNRQTINRLILSAFLIRYISALYHSFGDIVQPHVWRQVDTLGMSYRYFLRLTQEPLTATFFLPAALQSGDGNGIMPVEFPFLNFLFFPLWALGPYWGKVAIYVLFSTLVFWLCKKLSETRMWMAKGFLLLPLVSYSAGYADKFIPDTIATLFVALGMARLLENRKRSAVAWISLGLLIKPPAVAALALLFSFSKFRKNFIRESLVLAIPVSVCALYYTVGLRFIDSFRTGNALIFAVHARPPLTSLKEVFTDVRFLGETLLNHIFFGLGLIPVAIGIFTLKRPVQKFLGLLAGLFVLQFTAIALLDGHHSTIHSYYYMGLSLVAAAILIVLLRRTPRIIASGLALILLGQAIALSLHNTRPEQLTGFYRSRQECQALKAETPQVPWNQAYVFRSSPEPFPALGLCFGERQGSTQSPYGFYYALDPLPTGCVALATNGNYLVAECQVSKATQRN